MEVRDVRDAIPTNYGDWPTRFGEAWKSQVATLKEKFAKGIEEVRMPVETPTDVPIIYAEKEALIGILEFLKAEKGFEYGFLSDITATDESPAERRFEVVYNLYSMTNHWRIRVKTRVREGEDVPTATGVWLAANWAEREVWDMFGVRFSGHPDLRRILMDERWEGHPLRKDYPLRGYQLFSEPMKARPELLE